MSESQKIYAPPGGDWQLIDLSGKKFTSLNVRGHYYLLFFGHTKCPDVTPITLHKLTKAVRQIKKSKESMYIDA